MSSEKELQARLAEAMLNIDILKTDLSESDNTVKALKADLVQRDRIIAKKDAQVEKQYDYIQRLKQTAHLILSKLDADGKLDDEVKGDIADFVKSTNELTDTIKGDKCQTKT